MAFAPPFGRVFFPSFDRRNAGGAWWNAFGAIPSANCIAAYQPKGAADLAASKINLANPGTYNAFAGVDPTFASATGWTGNGSSMYLRTGITPSAGNQTWSLVVRFAGATTANRCTVGFYNDSGGNNFLYLSTSAGGKHYYGSGSVQSAGTASIISSGTQAICGKNKYLDGAADGTLSAGSGSGTIREIYLLALDYNGASIIQYWAGSIQAAAIYNIDISANIAALHTAMAAL